VGRLLLLMSLRCSRRGLRPAFPPLIESSTQRSVRGVLQFANVFREVDLDSVEELADIDYHHCDVTGPPIRSD